MLRRHTQALRNFCEALVDRHSWVVVPIVAAFTLASNLTATSIWEAAESWGKWGGISGWRSLYGFVFVVTLVFLYFSAGRLFGLHAVLDDAKPRKHLILFLSLLAGDQEKQRQLAETCGIPAWLVEELSCDDLAEDLDIMAACKKTTHPWSWEMPLRALDWHRRDGVLQSVSLIGSCDSEEYTKSGGTKGLPGSFRQLPWFLNLCWQYPETQNLTYLVVDKRLGRYHLLEPTIEAPFSPAGGWNFEDFNELKHCLKDHLADLNAKGIPDQDIMIDFTGGQKVTSVVATAMTLNRPLQAQYIQTNEPWHAISYDVFLVFGDKGKIS